MRKVCVIPVVIGALGVATKDFRNFVERLEAPATLEDIRKTALLGTVRILRKY